MRVLAIATGGRSYHPSQDDAFELRSIIEDEGIVELYHGAAKHKCRHKECKRKLSLDAWAGECARRLGVKVNPWIADWDRYGRSAGPRRNKDMIDDALYQLQIGHVDDVVALVYPGGRGTSHCVSYCHLHGVRCIPSGTRNRRTQGLFQVQAPHFSTRIRVNDGRIVAVEEILKWADGLDFGEFERRAKASGWRTTPCPT